MDFFDNVHKAQRGQQVLMSHAKRLVTLHPFVRISDKNDHAAVALQYRLGFDSERLWRSSDLGFATSTNITLPSKNWKKFRTCLGSCYEMKWNWRSNWHANDLSHKLNNRLCLLDSDHVNYQHAEITRLESEIRQNWNA